MTANLSPLNPQFDGSDGQPDGGERLLAGKYKTQEELERGYQNLFEEGKKLVARIQALESSQAPPGNGWGEEMTDRVDPADRIAARQQDPVDALSMAGVPVNELKSLIRREVMHEFQPIIQGANARQKMVQDYPEFAQFEGELAQFLEANPQLKSQYNRAYAADPEVALKWVYGEFSRSSGLTRTSASGEAQAAARLDAGLPGRVTPQRMAPGEFDVDRYNKLKEEAIRTGDWDKVLAYKLRGGASLSDNHLMGLQG